MTERPCLRLTQEGRCTACGGVPEVRDHTRDGRLLTESICPTCNACRIDPKELRQEQTEGDLPLQRLTQARKTI